MNRRGLTQALAAAALFGAATPLSKSLLGSIGPVTLAGLLYLGAALGMLPVVMRRGLRAPWEFDGRTLRFVGGAVLFGGILGPILLLLGLQQAAAGSVSLWLNLEAAFTALLGFFVFRDRLDRNGWIGAGGILLASLILTWGEGAAALRAGLLVALACLCWAIDNHLTALIDGVSPEESTLWKGSAAGIVNLTAGFILAPAALSITPVLGALLMGVFSYGVSIVLYIRSAQMMGATRSQLIFSSAPFFGLFLAVFLLNEPLTVTQVIAGAIIAVSVVMLTMERHGHHHEHAALSHEHCHTHDEGHHDHTHVDLPPGTQHTHEHAHRELTHSHRHLPDIHHRHEHA